MEKVSLEEKFSMIPDHFNPRIAGELNGQEIKLVKAKGTFVWHKHENEDEMFLVIKGRFRMEFRDHSVELSPNDFIIVPRGVEHRPVADQEAWIMLFEPASTLNTGNTRGPLTRDEPEKI